MPEVDLTKYKLIDAGEFKKLERIGERLFCRPSPAAVWPIQNKELWKKPDIEFLRFSDGKGEWKVHKGSIEEKFTTDFSLFQMELACTSFGHIGVFPEQYPNWQSLHSMVRKMKDEGRQNPKILNLFAYTGGSSLACATAGAEVTHVDASKVTVQWARKNADLTSEKNADELKIRWIVDDVVDFVEREVRRGHRYSGIILDPPTYGRGPKKQVWKIEEDLFGLLSSLAKLVVEERFFVLLSSHSPGYTAVAKENILSSFFVGQKEKSKMKLSSGEMLIESQSGLSLPSGAYGLLKYGL